MRTCNIIQTLYVCPKSKIVYTVIMTERYVCDICAYEYRREDGEPKSKIPPGTPWEDIPENWKCPVCGAEKNLFFKQEQK